jgi:membrane-associated progesterone receptor component
MLLAFIDFSFETLLWGVLALLVVYLARQIFTPPPPPPRPRPAPKPIELREYSKEELQRCTGADPTTPILIAIKGKIYDVTRGRAFYGPGSSYL